MMGGEGVSILIKGMKMPENCIECMSSGLRTAIKCTEWTKISAGCRENERAWSCPLVDLGMHGDLIDRDALELDADYDDGDYWAYSVAQVYNAPTVIEAEDGT